jgi:hemolysin III
MAWLSFREPVSAWTHLAWMVLSLPGTWVLWRLSRGDALKRLGMLVFGLSLIFCYAGSWLYHAVPERLGNAFLLVDQLGIYFLIAGTVTPVALVLLRGRWRVGMLGAIWSLTLAGVGLRLSADLPPRVLTALYLALGWLAAVCYGELLRCLPTAKLRPVWIGGVLYSVGAVLNGLHWPEPFPPVFGAHEVFHLFVMSGSLFHYYFMLAAVLPYRPAVVAVPAAPCQPLVAWPAAQPVPETAGSL